ncbi:MAG: ABC transporter permease [Microbacteriaceae bacterium]|nr:ABC transporter permease [Microbacteriaceae bacterium]
MTVPLGRTRLRPLRAGLAGAIAASAFLLVLVVAAVAPALLTGADPIQTQVLQALRAPSIEHPFGTDQTGRDVFARVVYGTRYSLAIGVLATTIAMTAGLLVGTLAGLAPRVIDGAISRVIEVLMSFPEFLLALLVIAILGPGPVSLVIAISLAAVPVYARVARVQTFTVRRSGYVRAALILGVPKWRSVLRHVVPNTLGPLLVMATIGFGTAIASAAGLSFLGLGPQPPTPGWGLILSEGRNFLGTAWWIAVFPGLVVTVTVISASVLGRFLRARGEGTAA